MTCGMCPITVHETFIDQIVLSDVLVANKMDLADSDAISLFQQWANNSCPEKALIAQTQQGQLDIAWLDISRNPQRQAAFPDAHQITKLTPAANTNSNKFVCYSFSCWRRLG